MTREIVRIVSAVAVGHVESCPFRFPHMAANRATAREGCMSAPPVSEARGARRPSDYAIQIGLLWWPALRADVGPGGCVRWPQHLPWLRLLLPRQVSSGRTMRTRSTRDAGCSRSPTAWAATPQVR